LSQDFTGQVVSFLDGDTIEVLHNTRAEPDHKELAESHSSERLGHFYGMFEMVL
jgi:hypothetical protein